MALHAASPSENVVVVATGKDDFDDLWRNQSSWLNKDGLLDTRMTNALILKQFYRILVNDTPWHYWFILSLWHPLGFLVEIFSWKVESSAQIVYVHDNFLSRFEVYCNLIYVNIFKNKKQISDYLISYKINIS